MTGASLSVGLFHTSWKVSKLISLFRHQSIKQEKQQLSSSSSLWSTRSRSFEIMMKFCGFVIELICFWVLILLFQLGSSYCKTNFTPMAGGRRVVPSRPIHEHVKCVWGWNPYWTQNSPHMHFQGCCGGWHLKHAYACTWWPCCKSGSWCWGMQSHFFGSPNCKV